MITQKYFGRVLLCIFTLFISHLANAMDFSWNGFGSGYVGQALNSNLLPNQFADNNLNFTNFSSMGLNLGASIDENFSFAAQLIALGSSVGTTDSYGLLAQWAYANYTPTDQTSIKFGRQLFPLFIASEFIRVGYLRPYQSIPSLVFITAPFTRFDGISMNQTISTSLGDLTLGIFGGTPLIDINSNTLVTSAATVTVGTANLIGAHITFDGDGWRLNATASTYSSSLNTVITSTSTTFAQNGNTQLYSVGYRYDKHNMMTWTECTMSQSFNGTPGGGGRYGGYNSGCYILAGYHIGKFTPRYTFAQNIENINAPSVSFPGQYANGSALSHSLGLNYQAGQKAVIKAEYQRIILTSAQDDVSAITRPTGSTATYADAFWAGVDYVF